MAKAKFDKKTYLKWYSEMLLWRKFEEKAGQLYIQQKIRGFCHLYIGQESLVAGAMSAIKKEDRVITAYRDHIHPIARGVEPGKVMAELYGKKTGVVKGKGGSMHMFSKEHNFFGGHGIVGGQIPLGAGIAFADKYRDSDNITLCFLGDGAVHQGSFHETLNMAMLWKLPVIFIIENNQYAMGTSVNRSSSVTDLYKLGNAYNIPSKEINGMICEDVHNAITEAVENVRKGKGPSLLEMKTYRYKGHSMSDPAKYRTKEEVESYKAQDPIQGVLETIKKKKFATEDELEKINKQVKKVVEDAVKFAEESEFPDTAELYQDVYTQTDYPFITD